MPSDSGTPADWLRAPSHRLVNVHCVCELEVAAMRFLRRQRHPGHLDSAASRAAIFASLGTLSRLAPLDIGERIEVDTSQEPNLDDVIAAVRAALGRA